MVVCTQKRDAMRAEALAKTKAKDKRGAMMALKKKKLFDKELEQLMNTKFSLEQQVCSSSFAPTGMLELTPVRLTRRCPCSRRR